MLGLLVKVFGIGAVLLGFMAYSACDTSANYYPVEAKVMKVETTCYLRKEERKSSTTSETTDCKNARRLADGHPQYKGYDVIETHFVTVGYRVDGDVRSRRQKLTYKRDAPKRYEKTTILVHKEDPDRIKRQ